MSARARHWCFTLNNYTEDDFAGLPTTLSGATYYVVGKEVGVGGTPHLQGFVSFANPRRFTGLRRSCFAGRAHWEVARHPSEAAAYCKKQGDFCEHGSPPAVVDSTNRANHLSAFKEAVKGGVTDLKRLREEHSSVCAKYPRFVLEYVRDQVPEPDIEQHELRQWQRVLTGYLDSEPDRRTVCFVVDSRGNSGKSWFADHYRREHPEEVQVMNPGKKADMAFALNTNIRVLILDAPRSKQGEFIQYDFLEDCKNGRVFSGKYESGMKYLSKVHVVVMMNEEPDMDKLSEDRYKIIRPEHYPI